MEPAKKRIKLEDTSLEVIGNILSFVRKPDLKNVYLVCKEIYSELSRLNKTKVYLYLLQPTANVNDILNTKREFDEIFFHGKQDRALVNKLLEEFGPKLKMLSFGKSDLTFLKVPALELIEWLNFSNSITHLSTTNIEISNPISTKRALLGNLKKLKCDDSILAYIQAPNLEKLKVFTTDLLTDKKLQNVNNFFERHSNIKYLGYSIYNCEDTSVQNCAFDMGHLELTNLRFHEFRYDIEAAIQILKSQPKLKDLRMDDGSYSDSREDVRRVESFPPLFREMLKLKYLEKLYVEMPSDEMMRDIPKQLKNLTSLKICSITEEMLSTFQYIGNKNVVKLCIENLEHGKKHLSADHIKRLAKSYPNLTSFKTDTLPAKSLNSISVHMKKLKKLTIIRNEYGPQKMKKEFSATVKMHETNLERITCRYEDYKLRILPLIQVCQKLKHVKVYWDNKNIPFMQIIFEILMFCPQIQIIDFPFDGVYIKANVIGLTESFPFSYKNRDYEVLLNKKKGKVICNKVN